MNTGRIEGWKRRIVERAHCLLGFHGRVLGTFDEGVLYTRCVRCGAWVDPAQGYDFGPDARLEALRSEVYFIALDRYGKNVTPARGRHRP